MAILVSGGAGYIGSHTCIELLNAGFDIVVADNYYNASPVVLDRVKQITGKDFRFYQADMTKHEDVEKMLTIDYLMANFDRHWNNFGVLIDSESREWLRAAPVFDTCLLYTSDAADEL